MLGKKIQRFERRFVRDHVFSPVSQTSHGRSFWKQDFWIFLCILALDQASKQAILAWIPKSFHHVLTSFFNLVHVQNRGVSFGLFPAGSREGTLLLVAISLSILIFLGVWYRSVKSAWARFGLTCIMAGAVGNMIDRLLYSGVIDFLDFHLKEIHFPAFNVADTAITLGAMILILIQLLESSGKRK
ncbi:MAG: signal peptidase II [Alphaproteobacteria bacterium]